MPTPSKFVQLPVMLGSLKAVLLLEDLRTHTGDVLSHMGMEDFRARYTVCLREEEAACYSRVLLREFRRLDLPYVSVTPGGRLKRDRLYSVVLLDARRGIMMRPPLTASSLCPSQHLN